MPVFLMSIVAGALGLLALTYHFAYDTLRAQTFVTSRMQVSSGAYAFIYGTVTAIDEAHRTLTISRKNLFDPLGAPVVIRATVSDEATVVRQEQRVENGVITTLTSDPSTSFFDIRSGDRVAASLTWKTGQLPAATVVLFGNPL